MRYAVADAVSGGKGRITLAFFSIGSFLTIFIFGIIWGTRPAHKHESRYH
jgi:hypothetical protein